MANYCKKSSLESVANSIRGRSGESGAINFPSRFESEIDGLEIVQSVGSPSFTLTKSSKSYTIGKGRYAGGVVSVAADSDVELTPSTSQQSVSSNASRTLAKVKVKATPLYKVAHGSFEGSNSTTSWSINVGFTPEGAIVVSRGKSGLLREYGIAGITNDLHGTSQYGTTRAYSSSGAPGGSVNTPIVLGSNYVSISSPQITDPTKGAQTGLLSDSYYYCIWGK